MCRGIAYIGQPIKISNLIYNSKYSLLKQTIEPRYMFNAFNLSGCGFAAWRETINSQEKPIIFKSENPPFFNYNLSDLAHAMEAKNFIAHIRGGALTTHTTVSHHNSHPFLYSDTTIALAHNGALNTGNEESSKKIINEIHSYISAHRYKQMKGSTDSELVYALILSLADTQPNTDSIDTVVEACYKAFSIIGQIRRKHNVYLSSPMNLFISTGNYIIAIRYTFDFGVYHDKITRHAETYYSMWYTYGEEFRHTNNDYEIHPGEAKTFCIASEPLSDNIHNWLEMPEYSLITVEKKTNKLDINIYDFDF